MLLDPRHAVVSFMPDFAEVVVVVVLLLLSLLPLVIQSPSNACLDSCLAACARYPVVPRHLLGRCRPMHTSSTSLLHSSARVQQDGDCKVVRPRCLTFSACTLPA